MGREVKRVVAGFDWPVGERWPGYLNPFSHFAKKCGACDGSGYSPFAKLWRNKWYGHADFDPSETGSKPITADHPAVRAFVEGQVDRSIAGAKDGTGISGVVGECYYTMNGRLTRQQAIDRESRRLLAIYNSQWSHHPDDSDIAAMDADARLESIKKHLGRLPTASEAQTIGIQSVMAFDSYSCVRGRCERAGQPVTCAECDGHGSVYPSKAAKWLYEESDWKVEALAGDWWQVWETVSEGSPISPAFADPRELAEWMANAKPWGAASPMPADRWLEWITGCGWAPSMIVANGKAMDGVEGVLEMKGEK